jgi:tRNA(Ile)-lysidine synthase
MVCCSDSRGRANVSAANRLPAVVEQFLQGPELAGPGVVAVSGGPDSVALLRALLAVRGGHGLTIAHLNHALRGAESNEDEAFVRKLHAALAETYPGLLLRSARIDIPARARGDGESVETTARICRYEWLEQIALEGKAGWIATGHTADDQAETVLHRLVRGTGLKGLCGIPARRELASGLLLVRPLLKVRREEVLAYLQELHQGFREDSSNQQRDFTRNRIRHELLPQLATFNPAIITVLCRLAGQAMDVQADLEDQAAYLLYQSELPRAGSVLVFDVTYLDRKPRYLLREMFRALWTRERWPQRALGFEDWDRLAAMVNAVDGSVAQLAGEVQVRRRGKVIQFKRVASRERERPEE